MDAGIFAFCLEVRERISGPYGQTLSLHFRVRRTALSTEPGRAHSKATSIGKIASPAQGVRYFEKDGYYAKDDGTHREASACAGRDAEALGLSGPVDPERFRLVQKGEVRGRRRLGRREIDGGITHRPGRDVRQRGPKSVSLMSMVGGDERIMARS